MKLLHKIGWLGLPALCLAGFWASPAQAQIPETVPIAVDTAAPIVVQALKPKERAGIARFEGFVMNANTAQITVRSREHTMTIETFPLDAKVSAKMQQIVSRGGYQYGDKVTVFYETTSKKAVRVKGRPSRPA